MRAPRFARQSAVFAVFALSIGCVPLDDSEVDASPAASERASPRDDAAIDSALGSDGTQEDAAAVREGGLDRDQGGLAGADLTPDQSVRPPHIDGSTPTGIEPNDSHDSADVEPVDTSVDSAALAPDAMTPVDAARPRDSDARPLAVDLGLMEDSAAVDGDAPVGPEDAAGLDASPMEGDGPLALECPPGFAGEDCAACLPGLVGPQCDQCADPRFEAPECQRCQPEWTGVSAVGHCGNIDLQHVDCLDPAVDCADADPGEVCGCDHQVYPSACTANRAGVTVWHLGPCVEIPCERVLDPVCGPRGICACPWGEFLSEGVFCEAGARPFCQPCSAYQGPVCGAVRAPRDDGIDYADTCHFRAEAGVNDWVARGVCPPYCPDGEIIDGRCIECRRGVECQYRCQRCIDFRCVSRRDEDGECL